MAKRKKKILLSFVGNNDAGKLIDKPDGAILNTLQNEKFDKVYLIWNDSKFGEHLYSEITKYLESEIKKRKLSKEISDIKLPLKDVTDHNEIYTQLKEFIDTLDKSNELLYTAAISSGTPAMQVSWILLAESGDFSISNPLRLIKTKDPKFGKSQNIEVKLDTNLPRVIRLTEELNEVKRDLIPLVNISITHGSVKIGELKIDFSPIEFCYYRYFAERVTNEEGLEKFSGYTVSLDFMRTIFKYHEESFYDFYSGREDLEELIRKEYEMGITTFRGNISKLNSKIKSQLDNDTLINTFQIVAEGKRGAKFYGLKLSTDKITIIK